MLAKDLITQEVPPLKLTDNAGKALTWMDEFKVSHLPVIKGRAYLGLISESEILDLNSEEDTLGELKPELLLYSVTANQHLFEVIKFIAQYNISVIPVLSFEKEYLGSISLRYLTEVIAELPFISEYGATIVLEMHVNDYYLSQITRIVESEDARILGTFITSQKDANLLELTIKLNKQNVKGIIQSLERFNYTVIASFDQGEFSDSLKDRYSAFMKYLNT